MISSTSKLNVYFAFLQLFGDTMNTVSRIETSSYPGLIQVSQETAELLMKFGKQGWLKKRQDKVSAKGKGDIQTYWLDVNGHEPNLNIGKQRTSSSRDLALISSSHGNDDTDRFNRLVDWNCTILSGLLLKVLVNRKSRKPAETRAATSTKVLSSKPLDEVCEIISLPEFGSTDDSGDSNIITSLPEIVSKSLHDYILRVACLYRNNAFHK